MDELSIVYQDKYLLVIDKPSGLIVNKAESVSGTTLQDLLSAYLNLPVGDLGIGGRAGIVHRLDRETSGLIICAKTQKAFENLQKQFKERQVEKEYLALCHGRLEKAGVISGQLGRHPKNLGKFAVLSVGREAETKYQTLKHLRMRDKEIERLVENLHAKNLDYYKQFAHFSYLHIFPKTGRTHQIRVHLKSLQRPLVSDRLYLGKRLYQFDILWCPRLFLHAARLKFSHPVLRKTLELTSDLPNDLEKALNKLEEVV